MQGVLQRDAMLHCTGFAQHLCRVGHILGSEASAAQRHCFTVYVLADCVSSMQRGRSLMQDTYTGSWILLGFFVLVLGFFLSLKSYLHIRLDCDSCKFSNSSGRLPIQKRNNDSDFSDEPMCLCEMFTSPCCLDNRDLCFEEQREIGLIWKREGSAWMLGKTFQLIWGQEPNSGQCVIEGFQEEAGQQLQGLLHQARDVPSTLF